MNIKDKRKIVFLILTTLLIMSFSEPENLKTDNFYDYQATSLSGEKVAMKKYQNKVVLVVNTASKCGLTPQYEGLEALYKKHKDKGFVVLGFPCNQFGKQEPGDADDIKSFCTRNYGVSFDMFSKITVNGSNTHPIYKFLKNKKTGVLGKAIKWNFTKFLIDKHGKVIKRYSPKTEPENIEKDIVSLL